MQTIEGKPKIDYPIMWEYRVIGTDKEKLKAIIHQIIKQDYQLQDGQSSSGGKFISVVVQTQVQDEAQRDQIFRELKENAEVKMVL